MADESNTYRPRCINLYSKSMLVFGEAFAMDPEHTDGVSHCWCSCTARSIGPDGDDVSVEECSNPERNCFQEY